MSRVPRLCGTRRNCSRIRVHRFPRSGNRLDFMDLLTRTWRGLRRLLGPDALFTFGILAVVLALELVGRKHAATDIHDFFALLLLAGIGWLVVQKHRLTPLGWVSSLT